MGGGRKGSGNTSIHNLCKRNLALCNLYKTWNDNYLHVNEWNLLDLHITVRERCLRSRRGYSIPAAMLDFAVGE